MLLLVIASCLVGLSMQMQTRQGQGQHVPVIAFSGGISKNITMTHAEVVIYDRIFANIGGGFDPHTGIFTCNQAGLYVFQFHSLADSDQASWLELYHNSYYVCSTYGHTTNDYSSSGNSVVLRLSKGDQVYVKAVDQSFGSSTVLFGASDEVYSTFSGYLIAPVFEEFPIVG